MKIRHFLPLITLTALLAFAGTSAASTPEIHCKHFIYGLPTGTPATNDLVIRDSYALSSNDNTKFADWVCYRLTPHETTGILDLERKWLKDPLLNESETLEGKPDNQDDYDDAYKDFEYDRGHMAPNYAIATRYGREAQLQTFLMSNICPQRPELNRQIWKRLEQKIAK